MLRFAGKKITYVVFIIVCYQLYTNFAFVTFLFVLVLSLSWHTLLRKCRLFSGYYEENLTWHSVSFQPQCCLIK